MTIKWKCEFPRTAVQMIPIDPANNILVMHRSEKLRSARNVWSFPSGLQKVGETYNQCAARELEEEFALKVLDSVPLGLYENIAGDKDCEEQYHWLIIVLGVRVENVDEYTNKEPDKHDIVEIMSVVDAFDEKHISDFLITHPFHPSFAAFAKEHYHGIYNKLRMLSL